MTGKLKTKGFRLVAVLVFGSCISCGTPGETDGKAGVQDGTPRGEDVGVSLPSGASSSAGDCEGPVEAMELGEWIGAGDGVIIGDVVSIEPAMQLAYASGAEQDLLRSASECEEVQRGFKVTLENTRGYLHDRPLDKEETLYFGYEYWNQIRVEHQPEVGDDGVQWPAEADVGIVEGMRIGGLVFHEKEETERLSFGLKPNLRSHGLFQVINDDISFQAYLYDWQCGDVTPVDEIEELGELELLDRIEGLDAEGELYREPADRQWAVHDSPIYDEGDGHIPNAGFWLATCWWFEPGNPPNDEEEECRNDGECEGEQVCNSDGACEDV